MDGKFDFSFDLRMIFDITDKSWFFNSWRVFFRGSDYQEQLMYKIQGEVCFTVSEVLYSKKVSCKLSGKFLHL